MPELREPLTAQELKFYGSIFQTLDPTNSGTVSGGVAKPLLEASGLPLTTLGEIWNIADSANKGYLDKTQFCVAMRLIGHAQSGQMVTESTKEYAAPLAKFGHIQPNLTGTAVPQSSSTVGSRVSSNSSTRITNPSLIVPLLSPTQAANFGAMFDKTAVGGILPGNQAKAIFMKARLPVSVLEQVWDLVDQTGSGQLSKPQFIVAMHPIQCFMNKSLTALPAALSDQLWKVAQDAAFGNNTTSSPTSPAIEIPQPKYTTAPATNTVAPPSPLKKQMSGPTNLNTWIMSDQQKHQYGAIFDTLDTKHESIISSGTVANFLMTSKLPNETLANIWELSNLDQSENFNKQEFSIAMYLVQKTLAGYELPEQTPIELIKSSSLNNTDINVAEIPAVAPQSFADAKAQAAPQRSASHMDDLLGIFKTADQVAPSPPPPPPPHYHNHQQFSQQQQQQSPPPTLQQFGSNFGREMQQKSYLPNQIAEEEESSDDEDEAPENLDLPRLRGSASVAPEIPGRSSKPHYDALKSIGSQDSTPTMFSSQPASGFTNSPNAANVANVSQGFSSGSMAASAGIGALAGAAVGFTGSAVANAFSGSGNNDQAEIKAINNQITQASVDIANHSNEVNSLSKQTSIISSKKEKAQNDLNKILNTKESIIQKLNQLKALNEKESQQVIEVQNLVIKSKAESDELENQLRIAEANYHAEQTKKDQLQQQYDEAQKQNQIVKEKLGTLNAETTDLKQQIEEISAKLNQANNLLAVTQQQVVTQEQENEELKVRLSDLNNTIFQVESKHQSLLAKLSSLNDENLELHEQHTDLSIKSANKNVEYSQTLADAASKGLAHDDDIDVSQGEVPTAELDDDFDKVFGLTPAENVKEVSKKSEGSENSDFTTPSSSGVTSATELSSNIGNVALGAGIGAVGGLALGHAAHHSDTSSTQNNAPLSERNDTGDEANTSGASTIENSPLSSQVLPEGQPEITEPEVIDSVVSETPEPQGESFELVERPEEKEDITDTEDSKQTDTPVENTPNQKIDDEFPANQEVGGGESSSSTSSQESFEDAPVAQTSGDKNPFSKNTTPVPEGTTTATATATENSASVSQAADMFDDLGLEDAVVDENDAFEAQPLQNQGLGGFSFSGLEPAETTAADGDDWEQVFAGFGNDPNVVNATEDVAFTSSGPIQPTAPSTEFTSSPSATSVPAPTAPTSSTTTAGEYTNAQKLAIEELSAMGFEKDDIIVALEKNNWNIDDASNYLIDA
ncbi:hypothetical protein CANINC_004768 [Pichia inconspicua]|uniref:Actin cytoskeleton-regulatory complex protein PAN1 n=1 Tax=Pichia inconspicua TaxID=52247 RepID=A0A4T0WWT3_9ASCO|nr:hypothetical protein CANINC_004768 [[Candida] inconspicua]